MREKWRLVKVKKIYIFLFLSVWIFSGCTAGGGSKMETADLKHIDTIYIDHGSTNVHIKSVDQSKLEASHPKPIIDMKQNKKEISINIKKSKFHIGPKMNFNKKLHVDIPKEYKGNIIINGASGNITAEGLETEHIEAVTKSGDIYLEFGHFHSDVHAKTASGNVELLLNEKKPDMKVTTKTASGRQMVAIPLSISRQDEKEMEGTSGNGKYKVKIETSSGNISVQ
jgi:hypothetical protein